MLITQKTFISTDEKVFISCDFESSPKCRKTYYKVYKNVLKCRANNNGKDRCCYCFNTLTKSGSKNFNYKYNKDENFFDDIDCELKAYFLGWIAGDGCVLKDCIKFEIHKDDVEILNLFKESLKSEASITYHKVDNTCSWAVHSAILATKAIEKLGLNDFGHKSDKICIPQYMSNDLKLAFLRGEFEADGSITTLKNKHKYPSLSISSRSMILHKQIEEIAIQNSIISSFNEANTSTNFNGEECLKFSELIYKNSQFSLKRKYNLYLHWKNWTKNTKPNLGKKFSKETRDKMSESGKISWIARKNAILSD